MNNNLNEIKQLKCYRYAENVLNGNIVAGELIKLACKRFVSDLERDEFDFRYEIGNKFVKFASVLKHFKGKSSNKNFVLSDWQEFIAYNILCFYHSGTDNRRFTSSLISISRKSGKTAFAALFCLWFLLFDKEGAPEVDLSANSLEQAKVAYEFVENFTRQLDPKQKDLKVYRKKVFCEANGGKINVFAADSSKLDGFNASFALIDEMGAARDSKMYDVLKSSQGQRQNPHLMIISTAGFDLSGPFYRMCQIDSEILHGVKTDDSHFAMIFSLDENDDYTDENNWQKIAPNLGITVDKKFLREQVQQAKNNPSAEVGILTKTFNKWCSSIQTWISADYINKVSKPINVKLYNPDNYICYVGIDLAATSDLTCLSLLLVDENENLCFKNFYYLPESALIESPNRELYKYWHRIGQLIITPGNVTDYDYVLNDLMKLYNELNISKVFYDAWNATQFVIKATEQGLPMQPMSQSFGAMSKPTKTLERLIKMQNITIDNNEITRWCFANATTKSDWNENIKVVKGGGQDSKIDGVVAIIMSLGGYLSVPHYSGSIMAI